MTITLRQLEVFLALAEHEHVGRAAEALHLSPSATSSSLAALESALGYLVFDRAGRGLRLNADGRRLRGPARATIEQARETEALLSDDRGGRLVVGASTTIATYVLAAPVAAFARDRPAADIRLVVGNTREVRDLLLDYALDLAYVEGPVVHPDLTATPWREDQLVVFAAPGHPLAAGGRVDLDALDGAWVLREEGSGTRDVFVQAIGDAAARLTGVLEVGSSGAVAEAVAAGGGLGCLSGLVVRRMVAAGQLVELAPPPSWDLRRTLWRLEHRGARAGRLVEAFTDYLAAESAPAFG